MAKNDYICKLKVFNMLITFGYKNNITTIVRAAVALLLGVLLLTVTNADKYIIQLLGIVIIIAGLVCLIPVLTKKDKPERGGKANLIIASITCGIATLVGLLFVLSPGTVNSLLFTLFAIALILFGALEILVLVSTYSFLKPQSFMGWLPLILAVAAIILAVVFFTNRENIKWILALGLIIYGVSELISMFRVSKVEAEYEIRYTKEKEAEKEAKRQIPADKSVIPYDNVKDVDYESVDKQ